LRLWLILSIPIPEIIKRPRLNLEKMKQPHDLQLDRRITPVTVRTTFEPGALGEKRRYLNEKVE
jgi:hypothetical protein